MTLLFFVEHLTVIFTKFEGAFIEKLLRVLLFAMNDPAFEIQSDSVSALNAFNEFVHQHISATVSPKTQDLSQAVKTFF